MTSSELVGTNILSCFSKKCIREGKERKTHGGKTVFFFFKDLFSDWRRWLSYVFLGDEVETRERRKAEDAKEKARLTEQSCEDESRETMRGRDAL